eukprot:CAMPEP_0206224504 /NCGR_PEP_ID=MMETSP0047_2-20121206/7060_1 /ASSEMBLY_ACC=CAM_ASM_000192 /TAXON_ID=195065 /ORGANISM="Chroomonas mesostigmatica_cf, Strain CCMP1168" /LENGTH=218 /DNA_ID=CAMNT_0053647463 /DNA_START=237 /DNA_END=890 /DNA_ORIENTATION=+
MSADEQLTKEELDAIAAVRERLEADPSIPKAAFQRGYEIVATTLICKCRVEKAVEKYKGYIKMMERFGCADAPPPTDEQLDAMDSRWGAFQVCGRDNEGRGVMWIQGQPILPEHESTCIQCSSMYFFAVHADLKTLREGVTFVIDSGSSNAEEKVGNERKMQEAWQAYPLRPKHFFITNASMLQRVFINTLLTIVGAFAYNNKVVRRLRFVTIDDVRG